MRPIFFLIPYQTKIYKKSKLKAIISHGKDAKILNKMLNPPMYKITMHCNPMGFIPVMQEHLSYQQNKGEKAYNYIKQMQRKLWIKLCLETDFCTSISTYF